MLLLLANGAAQDRQWQTAYQIAQLDDVLPQGALVSEQPIGVRDKYSSLAFLAGSIALDREPAVERGADVRPLRPRRQVAPGAD